MPEKVSREVEIDGRLERLLAKAGARDRAAIEKRLATLEAEPDPSHAILWRRLLVKLSELVPLPVHPIGSNALQFFVPDGKYRMQVFALDDSGDGMVSLYLPDVLGKAVSSKLLVKSAGKYSLPDSPTQTLTIQQMDVSSQNPPDFMKHMIGWNRKAVKLTLNVSSKEAAQVKLAEQLCTLAAEDWESVAK
jgi:hypothetical protein